MKLLLTLLAMGVAVQQAVACANPGDACGSDGETNCECNEGYLLQCELYLAPIIDGEGGETEALWTRVENCPVPAGGGLQCVGGACAA